MFKKLIAERKNAGEHYLHQIYGEVIYESKAKSSYNPNLCYAIVYSGKNARDLIVLEVSELKPIASKM